MKTKSPIVFLLIVIVLAQNSVQSSASPGEPIQYDFLFKNEVLSYLDTSSMNIYELESTLAPYEPTISPDGKYLLVFSRNQGTCIVQSDLEVTVCIPTNDVALSGAYWSSDSSRFTIERLIDSHRYFQTFDPQGNMLASFKYDRDDFSFLGNLLQTRAISVEHHIAIIENIDSVPRTGLFYVVDIRTQQVIHQLPLDSDYNIEISPDGTRLIFSDSQLDSIRITDLAGNVQMNISAQGSWNGIGSNAIWSDDGTHIMWQGYAGTDPTYTPLTYVYNLSTQQLFESSKRLSRLYTFGGGQFSWSPDGKQIAIYDCPDEKCGLYLHDVYANSETVIIPPSEGLSLDLNFSAWVPHQWLQVPGLPWYEESTEN